VSCAPLAGTVSNGDVGECLGEVEHNDCAAEEEAGMLLVWHHVEPDSHNHDRYDQKTRNGCTRPCGGVVAGSKSNHGQRPGTRCSHYRTERGTEALRSKVGFVRLLSKVGREKIAPRPRSRTRRHLGTLLLRGRIIYRSHGSCRHACTRLSPYEAM
jgi:hypothetical protein